MFTVDDRQRIRSQLLDTARADARLTGVAVTGSGASGPEDAWSDIDLAFGVDGGAPMDDVLSDWTTRMYRQHQAVHHFDVMSGAWVYRVFLLASTLQVDLAFAPEKDFGARAPTFRLVTGRANELKHVPPPKAETLIGYAWLYALHTRSCLARGKPWQAEYMVSAMRDHVLALACLRHGLPAREGRGMDQLPGEVRSLLEESLVGRIEPGEIARAFRVVTTQLVTEIRCADQDLATRLEPIILALSGVPDS